MAGCATVETTSGGLTGAPRIAPPAGPRPRQISAAEWRAAVLQWLGTPYRYGGNDRRGVDCSGFTQQLYKSVAGINLPRTAQAQFGVGISVPRSALRAGDLVFFSESGRGVFHVGISLGGDEFAHASTTRGVTITSLRDPWYAKRWCGAKRVIW
ncbi:MAG: NlpC/P60 family protein [Verrucomicrobiae bacterium]|nr:NlpC/P60 family protein [Verrucomicrobiae bacterium]